MCQLKLLPVLNSGTELGFQLRCAEIWTHFFFFFFFLNWTLFFNLMTIQVCIHLVLTKYQQMKKKQNNCFLIPCNSIIFQKWNSAFLTISKFYIIEFVLNVVAIFFSMYKSKSVKKKSYFNWIIWIFSFEKK